MKRNIVVLYLTSIIIFSLIMFSISRVNSQTSENLACNSDSDCPIGICQNGKEFPQYSCGNGICNPILYFVDPCLDLSSSSGSSSPSECKCADGEYYDGTSCIKGTDIACTLEFNPVCGCNGTTYGNVCSALANGIKQYSEGECLSNSSSGSISEINKNFAGTWRGKVTVCKNSTSEEPVADPLTNSNCIICPQIEILCIKGTIRVPQTCNQCAHCEKCRDKKSFFLRTCVKGNSLEGLLDIQGIITNGMIISTSIQSPEQISITAQDKQNKSVTVSLVLNSQRSLSGDIELDFYNSIEARKVKSGKKCVKSECPIPSCIAPPEGCTYEFSDEKDENGCPKFPCGNLVCSSSGFISDCGSKGSCRGNSGEELTCPSGTECSGLPAYGCYPPGCPVPICCSPHTMILTSKGYKDIENIKVGEYVISDNGEPSYVIKTSKLRVYNHKIVEVKLNDGTVLEISPGHPIGPRSITFGALKPGFKLDKREVVSTMLVEYKEKYTYDILPNSLTGNYYANGVLIGSSLYKSSDSPLYR